MIILIILTTGFLCVALSFVFRVAFHFFPKKTATIEKVVWDIKERSNVIYLKIFIDYAVENKIFHKILLFTEASKNSDKIKKRINDFNGLKGKDVGFYYFPLLHNYGYLDNDLLIKPLWLYLMVILVGLVPMVSIFIYEIYNINLFEKVMVLWGLGTPTR